MKYINELTQIKNFINLNDNYFYLFITTFLIIISASVIKKILLKIITLIKDNKTEYKYKQYINFCIASILIILLLLVWMPYLKNVLTVISFISAAMTIALREIIFNIFSGIFIKIKKPFNVEDRIEVNEIRGDVININLMNFEILEVNEKDSFTGQSTGIIVVLPNSIIFSHSVKNFNKVFKYIWNEMTVNIPLDADLINSKKVIYKIVNSNEIINKIPAKMKSQIDNLTPSYRIYYNKYDPIIYTRVVENHIELNVRYLIHPKKVRYVESSIWEQILKNNSNNEIVLFKE